MILFRRVLSERGKGIINQRSGKPGQSLEKEALMALFKRGKVWWMRFHHEGRKVRKSTGVSDKRLAEKIYCKVKTQLAEGKWFEKDPDSVRTLEELMERYLAEHSAVNKTQKSYVRDEIISRHLLNFFGDINLTEIRPSIISQYKGKRRRDGVAPRTINYELAVLGHSFNLAMKEWEWVSDNPVSKVSKEKVNNQIERWLTLEEERRLLDVSPQWLREVIVFAVNTGFRRGEILALKWTCVDLFRKTVTLLEQKNGSKDTLPLNEGSLSVLKERAQVRHLAKPGFVFCNDDGSQIGESKLRFAFDTAVRRAGIEKLRFHDLRHTFATRLVQAGVDIYTVQKLGRWKSVEMVQRYAHHHTESLRSGVRVLDELAERGTKRAQLGFNPLDKESKSI